MSKRIYVSPSSQSENLYAVGGTNEKEQCEKIAKACVAFLQKNGFVRGWLYQKESGAVIADRVARRTEIIGDGDILPFTLAAQNAGEIRKIIFRLLAHSKILERDGFSCFCGSG